MFKGWQGKPQQPVHLDPHCILSLCEIVFGLGSCSKLYLEPECSSGSACVILHGRGGGGKGVRPRPNSLV